MNPSHALDTPELGESFGLPWDTRPATQGECEPRGPHDPRRRDPEFERPSRARSDALGDSPEECGLLSAAEERELADRIKRGDEAAREQLVLANLRLVVSLVRRYRTRNLSFDDLVQEGNLGLIRASQDFDPAIHGTRFASYAELWISRFVWRALIANDSLIRVPEHLFALRKRYYRMVAALGGSNRNSDPRTEAATFELSVRKKRAWGHQLQPTRQVRIESPTRAAPDGTGEAVPFLEAIVDHRRPDEEAALHEEAQALEAALARLHPVEAWVISERYGLSATIPGGSDWAIPNPPNAPRPNQANQPGPSETSEMYFHRTYPELEVHCGLSIHRIHQVEHSALEKLRDLLDPELLQSS